jgi:eukaryotic-like serine/threonine-protein kinase
MNGDDYANAVRQHFPSSSEVVRLGEGTFGVTYRVTEPRRRFVVKVFKPQFSMARNEREIEYLGVVRSPYVVSFVSEGTLDNGGVPLRFLATEYIDGQTLRSRLQTRRLSRPELKALARDCTRGLQALHDAGLTHRDLKPENIMVSTTGRFVIIDLGIAKREGAASLTIAGDFLGTYLYASLEQLLDAKHVDIRADLFSLGCVLFESAVGNMHFPYHTGSEQTRLQYVQNIRHGSIAPFDAGSLTAMIRALLAPAAYQRPATPALFLSRLGV